MYLDSVLIHARDGGLFQLSKTVFITGASSGFGLLTAIELAKANFHVYASMRNLDKKDNLLKQAHEANVKDRITILPLDVTSPADLATLKEWLKSVDGIDILINNAGFAEGGFVEELTVEQFEQQWSTNVFGLIAVTKLVIPYMRKRQSGKIINMSSISGRVGFPALSPYVTSKYAVEGFSESLRLELKPFGIDVALIEPGSYDTSIWDVVDTIAEKSPADSPYRFYLQQLLNQLKNEEKTFGDPKDVASLIVTLCQKRALHKLRYPIGRGVKAALILKTILPWRVWEKIVFSKLKQR